jgi:RimJ/RimL family protein N-acetyltransferase
MLALEEQALALGYTRVELNVFGGNEVARRLYRALGYTETAVAMAKNITGSQAAGREPTTP